MTSPLLKVILIVALTASLILFSVRGSDEVQSNLFQNLVRRVTTAPVTTGTVHRTLRFSGTLRAQQRGTLTFTMPGRLHQRPVCIGDRVTKGQLLAQLDPAPFNNEVSGAQAALDELAAQLDQNERDLQRVTRLVALKAATEEEQEHLSARAASLKAGKDAAQTRLREASRLRDEAYLRAPFEGTVTDVLLEPGEFAAPGQGVVTLSGKGHLEMEVEVPESILSSLKPGTPVDVELPFSGKRKLRGTIHAPGQSPGGPGRLFPLLIHLEEAPDLLSGMTAELLLEVSDVSEVMVPITAVINPGGQAPQVFRVQNGRVEKLPIRVGRLQGKLVSVQGELNPGDLVATAGFFGLMHGDKVEVAP